MENLWGAQPITSFEEESQDSIFVAGSEFLAKIEKIEWQDAHADFKHETGDKVINVQFRNIGENYKNLVQFMNIKIMSPKEKAAKRGIKFLSAIDGCTKAGLFPRNAPPTSEELQALVGKPLIYKLDTWSMKGKEGNHVNGIREFTGEEPPKPKKRAKREAPVTAPPPNSSFGSFAPAPAQPNNAQQSDNFDDDIPF